MPFVKRFEVWVLLLLSLAGIAWVFWSEREKGLAEHSEPDTAPGAAESSNANRPPIQIKSRRISREAEHLVLTIEVGRAETAKGGPVAFSEDDARLITESGESLPEFFLAFDPPPVRELNDNDRATLRYWFPKERAAGALWLEIGGERLPVKNPGSAAKSLDVPEGVEVDLDGPDWNGESLTAP